MDTWGASILLAYDTDGHCNKKLAHICHVAITCANHAQSERGTSDGSKDRSGSSKHLHAHAIVEVA